MFTPPPSPGLPPAKDAPDAPAAAASRPLSPEALKRRIGRRTRWTVVLVPLVLTLITLSTRYITHPAAFDVFSEAPTLNWETLSSGARNWSPHKRHAPPHEVRDDASGSVLFPSLPASATETTAPASSTGSPSQQSVPSVPDFPTLPAPFPQPFDSDLSQNFSSLSCFNFFQNMTNTLPFRSCRAFSLLLQSSNTFISAQTDLNKLNTLVWGTCNTDTDEDVCASNMAWFSDSLTSSCAIDLKDGNSMAVNTQIALHAFGVMRSAGCLVDPTTNSYCYLNAVHNSNPSDTYYYSLPLGINVPNNTIASCSACTKSLMTLYYSALADVSTAAGLDSLRETYPSAAKIAVADCGTAYATLAAADTSAASPGPRAGPWLPTSTVLTVVVSAFLLLCL
ncbi:hypothetical protein MKEN_00418200 [Mycena kentingensis (nom. inval.)]|nr:hypothetical protein MKEN_00418200 [Mycena kentingensis (nom. inval.)]